MRSVELCGYVTAAVISCVMSPAAAASIWDGETNILWGIGTNWNPNGVPSVASDVVIDNAASPNQPTLNVASAALNSVSVIAGSLTVDNRLTAASVTVSGAGVLVGRAGQDIVGDVTNNGAFTPNGLTISGDLILNGQSILFGGLNGLVVNGSAFLDGQLSFDLTGVTLGAHYVEAEVLRATNGISGMFSSILAPSLFGYEIGSRIDVGPSSSRYLITFTEPAAVPIPSAMALMAFPMALLAAAGLRRRKPAA